MRVAVIGAGVAGLVCAHRLGEAGHAADVYERWPGLGGQAATIDVGGGHLLERYYHHLFTSDRHIAELYDELGMPDELEWRPSSMAFFLEGRSWPFTAPLDLLRFGPLSLPARLRMGLAVLRLQKTAREVEPFEGITAREWIRKSMGAQPYEKVWGPLLRGKFGDRADDISMAWLWGKLTMRRKLEGKEARQELLGYPRRSWEPLFDALRESIEAHGGRVLIDRPVVRLGRRRRGLRADRRRGRLVPARPRPDHATSPTARPSATTRSSRPCPTTSSSACSTTSSPPRSAPSTSTGSSASSTTRRSACCSSSTAASARSTGPTSPTPSCPFVGLVEHTNFVEPERYDGRRFLYVANYLAPGDELLELDADALLERYTPGLRKVNPEFERSWVRERWLHREPAAQPIVTVGYREGIPPLQTGVPHLVLANTTQIYPEDRGTNYAVRLGGDAAGALLSRDLKSVWSETGS